MKEIERILDEIELTKEEISEYINMDWAITNKGLNILKDKVNELVDAVNFLRNIHFT